MKGTQKWYSIRAQLVEALKRLTYFPLSSCIGSTAKIERGDA
jgi:hypothetical protein